MSLRVYRLLLALGLVAGLTLATWCAPSRADSPSPAGNAAPPSAPAPANEAQEAGELLVGLMVLLIGAKLAGAVFEQLGQPPVLGEIGTGILLGNLPLLGFHGLEFLRHQPGILALSQLGVILLLFEVGLESNLDDMRRVGASALAVATLGVIAPFLLGWGVARALLPQAHPLAHLFIGAALCATSVGLTARVLKDLGQIQRPEAQIILGAAVLDDVMGLVVLAVVGGMVTAAGGGAALSPVAIVLIISKAVLFLVGSLVLGTLLAPRLFRLASFLNVQHMLLVTSLGFCFLLARLAAEIGLAPIVGAFAAGLVLDKLHYRDFTDRGEHHLEELIHPLSGFLVPIFFAVTGMSVDLAALASPRTVGLAAALTVAAILGKQVCGLGVRERGLDRLSVGFGMIPRGEVGLIFANLGLGLRVLGSNGQAQPVLDSGTFGAMVVVVMVTTLITPSLLKWSLGRPARPA